MPWTTLLEGPDRERVTETATAVSDALLASPPGGGDVAPTLNGTLGAVLFLAEWGSASGQSAYTDAAGALLDEAIDAASDLDRPSTGLYGAPLGVAWVDAMLRPSHDENDVDLFVRAAVERDAARRPNDLMHGLAGLGAYCLARLPRASARRGLERVVGHLARTATEDADGLTWAFVPSAETPFRFDGARPEGHVNLGFAHGVPGIVAFLAAAERAGVPGARELLDPAVRWLVAQRLPAGAGAAFPSFVFPGHEPAPSRLGWCYGDPGIAVALLAAGEALRSDGVVALARDVALGCEPRDEDVDATLCHGSAGLGHMFNRLGQALGDERLLELARRWFGVTLDRHLGGLTVVDREQTKQILAGGGTVAVDAGYGLLFGAAGVGLALASAVSSRPPRWDAALFVSPPA